MAIKTGCSKGKTRISSSTKCFLEKDKRNIQTKGFKYIEPVKSHPGNHWFKSPDGIKTIASPIGKITKKGVRRVAWNFGKRWGEIPVRYVHGAPKKPRYKKVNGRIIYG